MNSNKWKNVLKSDGEKIQHDTRWAESEIHPNQMLFYFIMFFTLKPQLVNLTPNNCWNWLHRQTAVTFTQFLKLNDL